MGITSSATFNREKHRGFWIRLLLALAVIVIGQAGMAFPIPGQAKTKVNMQDGLIYVWIPAGTFQMGCSPKDSDCSDDEKPVHSVKLTKGFWIGQAPVTQAAY